MAWDLANVQSQVQMATGDDGLASLTLDWANRTLMEIGTAAFWPKAIAHDSRNAITAGDVELEDAWTDITHPNLINIHRLILQATSAETYYHSPVQKDLRDIYSRFSGQLATVANADIEIYGVPTWYNYTASGNQILPKLVFYPNVSSRAFELHYLQAPDKATDATETNWIIERYFNVVLCGTLRRAFIYKGNVQRYQVELAGYRNGLKDMLRQELGPIANTPVMRALVDAQIQNLMR